MKQFYTLSFAVLIVFVAGCGTNETANQASTNSQSSNQNNQTKVSVKTNEKAQSDSEPTDLKQRTGIRYQPVQSTRDTLPLLVIMTNLEQNLAALQGGIWRGNYEVIGKAASALANHAKIPKREIKKIRAILGKKGLKNFVGADKYWHEKAKELAQKADEKNMDQIVNLTTELVQRCASCHMKYREPLRDSSRWLQR